MTVHKRKKNSRQRGSHTHGWGAKKKHRGAGNRGGKGMAGTGKRADQKKTLITALYGHEYFGKQGITSKKTQRDKRKRINIDDIELNIDGYLKRGIAKKSSSGFHEHFQDRRIGGFFCRANNP